MATYRLKRFSTSSDPKYRDDLSDYSSARGYGRSFLLGQIPGAIGTAVGARAASKADEKGLSDEEIISRSGKVGGATGAALGAARGASNMAAHYNFRSALGLKTPSKGASLATGALIGAGLVGTGSYLGARKNTRERLKKREYGDLKREARRKAREEE